MNIYGLKFTTRDLARELGVSKRAIYEHFPSKELLVGAVLTTILAELKQQITDIAIDKNLDNLAKVKALMIFNPKALGPINARVLDDVKRFLPAEYVKFETCFAERWEMIEEVIGQGVEAGLLSRVDLVILRKIYMGAIDQLLDYQFLTHSNTTLKNAMTQVAEILIWGLVAPHPQATILSSPIDPTGKAKGE